MLVINTKPQNQAVINTKPENQAVINTRPKNQGINPTENYTYLESRTINAGQPMLLMAITYPETITFTAPRL